MALLKSEIQILNCLENSGPQTITEIADRLVVSRSNVARRMERLRKIKSLHIGSYKNTHGRYAAVFQFGPGEDAEKPLDRKVQAQLNRHEMKTQHDQERKKRELRDKVSKYQISPRKSGLT